LDNSAMNELRNAEETRNIVLTTLSRLATRGTMSHVNVYDLQRESNIGDDFYPTVDFLRRKGFLAKFNLRIEITDSGIEEAERIVQNQRDIVLQKLNELAAESKIGYVLVTKIAQALGLDFNNVYEIFRYWEEKQCVEMSHEVDIEHELVRITSIGIDALEGHDHAALMSPSNITYNTTVQGHNYGGIQQGGQGNTQNVTLTNTNNPNFDKAIASIIELIRSSNLPADDKQELEGEVANVNKLALREPAAGLLERAKSRLDMVRLGLQGTDLLIKAGPHLEAAWEFLKHKFGG
jgi:hypothetical protein